MDIKTICVVFVALAIVSIDASTGSTSGVTSTNPDVTSSDTSGVDVSSLRSKRQLYGGYPYGGLGGGASNAFANANSFSGGGFGGGFSGASASAGSNSFLGKK